MKCEHQNKRSFNFIRHIAKAVGSEVRHLRNISLITYHYLHFCLFTAADLSIGFFLKKPTCFSCSQTTASISIIIAFKSSCSCATCCFR